MDSGFYAACSALLARTQALDTVANNLANSSTGGYRAQRNQFRGVLAASGTLSQINSATNTYGVLDRRRTDLSQGALERTGNPLDLAIEGDGFFVVQTVAGRAFTRNGSFHVSPSGELVTAEGDPVMGETGVVRVFGASISIAPDGTVSSDGVVSGKIKLVSFGPDAELKSLGKTYYGSDPRSEKSDSKSSIHQGMLESSNVNPIAASVDLIAVQRSAEMMQRTLSMFHSDFNRIATEELPRVSS